jgi:selenocysteine lyase/cysteine desulfurase
LATFELATKKADDVATFLMEKGKLHTTTVTHEGLNGVRISPHIYTSFDELDLLVETIQQIK